MSPGGDTFRRVQSGETFQMRAAAYNAMMDAANKARAVPAVPSQIASTTSPSEPKLVAYNASDYNAPRGGIVELRARGDTMAQVEFVRPGEEGGLDVWGIAIDPIPSGRMGRIVLAGGRWRFLAADAAVGDRFGAADGSWIAVADAAGPLVVARESIGGVAEGFFSRGLAGDLQYHTIAASKRLMYNTESTSFLDLHDTVSGLVHEAFSVFKPAVPHALSAPGLEMRLLGGDWSAYSFSAGGNNSIILGLEVVREDFDLATLTYEQYGALTRSVHDFWSEEVHVGDDPLGITWEGSANNLFAVPVSSDTAYGFAVRARMGIGGFSGVVTLDVPTGTLGFSQTVQEGDNW